MRLLKVEFEHLTMFKDGNLSLDFYAADKVPSSDESVTLREAPIYTNNLLAIAGINASGKTVALLLLDLLLRIIEGRTIGNPAVMRSFATAFRGNLSLSALLWHDGQLYCYRGQIAQGESATCPALAFLDEELYGLKQKRVTKDLLSQSFDDLLKKSESILHRASLEEEQSRFLPDNVSILSVYADGSVQHLYYETADMPLVLTQDFNGLDEILKTFDSSIKHLYVEDGGRAFRLQTANHAKPLVLSREGLEDALSSGTLKGLVVTQRAIEMLRTGGYLLLDEVEMHLNRQLVNVIIGLFASRKTNPHGAMLVFTTHYPEVLDVIHRKDNVYFFSRPEGAQCIATKYSTRVKRIENKKSEVFMSSFVQGTAPRYSEVAALKSYVETAVGAKDA